jgi:hypothetical protein
VLDSVNLLPELARPVDPNDVSSAWFTAPDGAYEAFERIRGASPYRARKGVYCATNAIYWLSSVEPIGANRVLVSNIADSGKRKVQAVTQPVEADFVHPLLRGKDVGRWKTRSELSILLPQQEGRPDKAVPESELRRKWPLTYAYFRQFEEEIRKCALLEQFFDQDKDAFYSSYNVGSYTFAPHKVVWREVAPEIQAAVVSTSVGPDPVPDHKLVCVACDTASAAHMLCAVLNSTPVRAFVRAYTVQTSISGHALEYIRVPAYLEGDGTHAELAALSKGCHETVDQAEIVVSEARIDELVRMMWGLSRKDLAAMSALLDD